jgi:hypothetical protein
MTDFNIVECEIRQLHARYCDAVWRKDFDAFADCFAHDAEWRIAGNIFKGRNNIKEAITGIMAKFSRILMNLQTPILEVGEGVAQGRTYSTEHTRLITGERGLSVGTYYERFVDDGDRWRFSWRLFQLHYSGPPDLSGPFFDNPDYGPPPAMPSLGEPSVDLLEWAARAK